MVYNCSFPFSDFISFEVYLLGIFFILVIFGYMFHKSLLWKNNLLICLFGFLLIIIGGSLNLGTRLLYGCVPDYFPFGNIFSFNFADIMVVFGLFLILSLYFNDFFRKQASGKES